MDAKISPSFWNDDTLATPALRLAALWLRTNPHVTTAGFGEYSLRRFTFETGLPSKALDDCFEALGSRCRFDDKAYWLRDFIAENFGRGDSLADNNFSKGIPKAIALARCPWLADAVYSEYPELTPESYIALEPLPRGSPHSPTTREEGEEGEDSKAGEAKSGSGVQGVRRETVRDHAEAIYAAYPKKVGRRDALKAIGLALREFSADHILERTAAFADAVAGWPPDRYRFIPHPATWFRRGSFDDDPATWVPPVDAAKNFGPVPPAAPGATYYDPSQPHPSFIEATAP